jgi:hypothetical protein
VDVRRLRLRGFESVARDAGVLKRHNRRYSLELPFGGVKQSGRFEDAAFAQRGKPTLDIDLRVVGGRDTLH